LKAGTGQRKQEEGRREFMKGQERRHENKRNTRWKEEAYDGTYVPSLESERSKW
jgi:hypothetical protein